MRRTLNDLRVWEDRTGIGVKYPHKITPAEFAEIAESEGYVKHSDDKASPVHFNLAFAHEVDQPDDMTLPWKTLPVGEDGFCSYCRMTNAIWEDPRKHHRAVVTFEPCEKGANVLWPLDPPLVSPLGASG